MSGIYAVNMVLVKIILFKDNKTKVTILLVCHWISYEYWNEINGQNISLY